MRLIGDDSMAIPNTTDSESTTTAVVTIRIPCGADGDLVTDAEKRLSRPETIDDVTIDELASIEPQLSATLITVEITVQWSTAISKEEIRDRLKDVSGLESIRRIE
jgi:glycine cleavage system regulatory protein